MVGEAKVKAISESHQKPPGEEQLIIQVEKITLNEGNLICSFEYDAKLEEFFNSSVLYINYDFDIGRIPMSVLAIPILGVLAPVAWVANAIVRAGEVDSRYLSSLYEVAGKMQKMYPDAKISSKVECVKVDTPWPVGEYRRCLLYSGGVDSTTSLIRNLGSNLSLASVRGTPELRLWEGEYWGRVQQKLLPFIRSLGIERHVIETNAIDVVNLSGLNRAFNVSSDGWWENLSHGLMLLSFCAPYTYENRISNMMIASSYSQRHSAPWGSTPDTDQSIGWGALTTTHDSFDLTRNQKIREVLVPYMTKHPGVVQLRVCTGKHNQRLESGTLNCGRCEKCVRTELALIWAGVDPAECGFPVPNFEEIKEGLISGRSRHREGTTLRTLQASNSSPKPELAARYPGIVDFFNWFNGWKIPRGSRKGVLMRIAPPHSRRRRLATLILDGSKGK